MEKELQQTRGSAVGRLAGAKILILEDQPDVAEILEALAWEGRREVVGSVSPIDDALALLQEKDISAAIITMIAGGIYTDNVARELLRQTISFVVTTGIGTDANHPELHAASSITKPFQPSYLQSVLAGLLSAQS